PEEGDGEGEEDAELGLGRFEQAEPPHEVHEDQQRQDGGQREDGARGFAELHWTLTESRPPKASPTTGFRRFLLVCRGLAQTQRRKGSWRRGGEIRQMLLQIGTPKVICKPVSPRGKRPARSRTSSPFLASPSGGSLTWPSA